MKPSKSIDPNRLKSRDYLMLKVIAGVTKAGVEPDRKKQENKQAARRYRWRGERE